MSKGLLDYLAKAGSTLPEEAVDVPEWGRAVTIRGFSSRERDLWEEDCLRRANAKASNGTGKKRGPMNADLDNFRARLVARSIVEDGVRTCANPRAEEMLGDQPASVLDRLFSVAQRLHGMSQEDIEAMSGNSAATEDSGQSIASPGSSDEPSQNSTVN